MKKLLLVFAVAGMAFGFSSCSKCVECSGSDCTTDEICRSDYGNKTLYDAAVSFEEIGDCTCK